MPVRKLTARSVAGMHALRAQRTDFLDAELSGFVLRVSPTGARSYAVVYRNAEGEQRRYTIGDATTVSLADARDVARRVLADAVKGGDPEEEKLASRVQARRRRQAPTFAALAQRFLDESVTRLRPNTLAAWRCILRAEISPTIGRLRPQEIQRADVRELIEHIASDRPTYANRVFELVRRVFSWAMEKDLLPTSPCMGLQKPAPERRRDRVLSDLEIRAVWAAAGEERLMGDALKLLLLTGARRDEVLSASWEELDIDAQVWRLPAARAKTGSRRTVPLSSGALEVINRLHTSANGSPWLFPSPRTDRPLRLVAKAVRRIQQRSRTSGWVWHDTRRTVRTRLAEMGIAPHVAEAVLGHVAPGIVRTYNLHEPVPEMRAALEAWARRLRATVEGANMPTAVVPLALR
jgi:integrase